MQYTYRLNAATPLTPGLILKYLEADAANDRRKRHLADYYIGKQDILKRRMADPAKPNHKIVNPYANYITDIMTGYFLGDPVTYTSEDSELLNVLNAIYSYNDESAENAELSQDASITGVAFEILYLDADKQIRFETISSLGGIPIYEDTIEGDLLFFIRYYTSKDILTDKETTIVEVYSRTDITTYTKDFAASGLTFKSRASHSFGMVPVVVYYNNKEALGDFEPVLSEIDAYDILESDSLNEMDYFADAYLGLYGMGGTDSDDIAAMKEQRVLLMPADGKAEWIVKNPSDTYIENMKTRIDANIHKFSKCPAMTDQDFAANASGVAMKYKLMGLENATSKKERAFKVGLQRRLELICRMLAVMGSNYDYRAVNIVFTRNIPTNLVEIAGVINDLGRLLSDETKISLLPLDVDFATEQARKQAEAEAGYSIDFEVNNNGDEDEQILEG